MNIVHYERRHNLNKFVSSKEEILNISKNIILKDGFSAFNMRMIADKCNISVGAMYNYFKSKSDLIISTVESIWLEILEPINSKNEFDSFIDAVCCMFETIKNGNSKYSNFFSFHSLNFASDDKQSGVEMMNIYFSKLKQKLILALNSDKNIRKNIFSDDFTAETFIDYIFDLIISDLLKKQDNCNSLIIFIKNYIY